VYVASFDSDAVATFDRDRSSGALTQKGGLAACVSETGTSGSCRDGAGLDGATSVAVSTDGFTVYVASSESDAIAVQSRNRSTGELTLKLGALKCVSETGSGGACADGVALDGIRRVAISADQRSVFATASNSGALAVFDRDTSIGTVGGALSQKPAPAGCVSFDGTGGSCATLLQTASATGLAVSPDGRNVYVTSLGNDAVSVFTRFVEAYDIDGDGTLQPLTDGLLLVRFLFGFSGNTLVNDAVNLADCTRCTAAAIEAYLESLGPTP
jgi:DNA-binding beta-propeller fold protein YncE